MPVDSDYKNSHNIHIHILCEINAFDENVIFFYTSVSQPFWFRGTPEIFNKSFGNSG